MSDVPVRYRLSVPHPESHHVSVEMRVPCDGDELALRMAAWCPGSYLIRDYARFVGEVEAHTPDGDSRRVRKVAKDTWSIDAAGAGELVVRYQVYGYDLTVRSNHIDPTHAFLHGPATYLYAESLRGGPHEVTVEVPDGWKLGTGLSRDGDVFRAEDLDELLDCPIHIGEAEVRAFEAAGKLIHLHVWGTPDAGGVADIDHLVGDLRAIIETHAARVGGLPFAEYTFILMLAPRAYGGLEHRSSSANLETPFCFASQKNYTKLLELLSHEFFHVWNGKRIFPEAHSPFDYSREAYTSCLWVMEGLTSYFDRYTVRCAKKMTAKIYLEKLCEEWTRLKGTPGRTRHSLEEASFDAWIKLYKPDPSNLNTTVSYYLKGGLVATALDLDIRARSGGQKSLDDVLRRLWEEYGARGVPYPENVQPIFEAACGLELDDAFDRLVRGREDPDLAAALAHVGLELKGIYDPAQTADGLKPVWLGVVVRSGSKVAGVLDDSPAADAGLAPRDEIVAIDTYRVANEEDLRARLATRSPGDEVALAVFRRDRLLSVPATVAEAPPTRWEIAGIANVGDEARTLYEAWMGEGHPGAETVAGFTVNRWL